MLYSSLAASDLDISQSVLGPSSYVATQSGTAQVAYVRGVMMDWTAATMKVRILYYLKGDTSCGITEAVKFDAGVGNTGCTITYDNTPLSY